MCTVVFDILGTPGSSSAIRITKRPALGELSLGSGVVPFAARDGLIAVRRSEGEAVALSPVGPVFRNQIVFWLLTGKFLPVAIQLTAPFIRTLRKGILLGMRWAKALALLRESTKSYL